MNASISNSSRQRPMSSAGFTLIELMITIAVLAIIASIAAPNISSQLANQRVKATTATLNNALREAKVESVIRRRTMEISYDNSGTSAGTIKIEDDNSNLIATYAYDARVTISGDDTEFKPDKTAVETTYTICDNNTSAASGQVSVSRLATINVKFGVASC